MVGENSIAADGASGGPLTGFRIVDLTTMISGPFATMMLGDQGADVIKVEAFSGDYVRAGGHRSGGLAASFLNNNRNKRSIAVDLKRDRGRRVLHDLARTADAVVHNMRSRSAAALGVSYEELASLINDMGMNNSQKNRLLAGIESTKHMATEPSEQPGGAAHSGGVGGGG